MKDVDDLRSALREMADAQPPVALRLDAVIRGGRRRRAAQRLTVAIAAVTVLAAAIGVSSWARASRLREVAARFTGSPTASVSRTTVEGVHLDLRVGIVTYRAAHCASSRPEKCEETARGVAVHFRGTHGDIDFAVPDPPDMWKPPGPEPLFTVVDAGRDDYYWSVIRVRTAVLVRVQVGGDRLDQMTPIDDYMVFVSPHPLGPSHVQEGGAFDEGIHNGPTPTFVCPAPVRRVSCP